MTTYYVDPSAGNDGNAGTAFGTAWLTTQKALNTAVAGDTVNLCATATESITATMAANTNSGGIITPIKFVAANSSGTVDGTKYTIQTTSGTAAMLTFSGTVTYMAWEDVIFDGNSKAANCVLNSANDTSSLHMFTRCQMKNATSDGINVRGSIVAPYEWIFVGCEINNNGGAGINNNTGNRGGVTLHDCSVHHNTGVGCDVNCWWYIRDCLIYRNGAGGILGESNSGRMVVLNTVFHANTTFGIQFFNGTSRNNYQIVGNVFSSNSTYGIQYQAGNGLVCTFCDYNCAYNNTSGATDLSGNLLTGSHNVTSDPSFYSTTNNSEDFRLNAGSPLIGAGANGTNIGPMPQIVSAGGNSGFIIG